MGSSVRKYALLGLAAALLGASASAGETQASLMIGGPGSSSSEGFNDPGLLADGVTEASATLDLTFDDVTGDLTIVAALSRAPAA